MIHFDSLLMYGRTSDAIVRSIWQRNVQLYVWDSMEKNHLYLGEISAVGQMIRLREHSLWRFWQEMGLESSADHLVDAKMALALDGEDTVCMPDARDVYVFVCRQFRVKTVEKLVWYCRSGLVSVGGILYFVYYSADNLLESYAWLLRESSGSVRIKNVGLRWSTRHDILTIYGAKIDRYTGERKDGEIARAKCIRMRPPVQWYAPGFAKDLIETYSNQNSLNPIVTKLQRWARTIRRRRKVDVLDEMRCVGYFDLLSDDLFGLISDLVFRAKIQTRQIECEFVE